MVKKELMKALMKGLNKDWKTTYRVAKDSGVAYSTTHLSLHLLEAEGKVESRNTSKGFVEVREWRIKKRRRKNGK